MSLIHSYTGYFDQVTCVSSRVKITRNSTVVFVQPNCTENTWDSHCWPFVRGTIGDWGSNAKNLSMSWCHHESFPMSRCLMFVESHIVVVATWWSMRKLTRSGVPATSKYNYLKKRMAILRVCCYDCRRHISGTWKLCSRKISWIETPLSCIKAEWGHIDRFQLRCEILAVWVI